MIIFLDNFLPKLQFPLGYEVCNNALFRLVQRQLDRKKDKSTGIYIDRSKEGYINLSIETYRQIE